jgi:hypothetical protein
MPFVEWSCKCGASKSDMIPASQIGDGAGQRHPADESYPCKCGGVMVYEFTRNRHPKLDFPLWDVGDRYAAMVDAEEGKEETFDQKVDIYNAAQERKAWDRARARGENRIVTSG